MGSPFFTVSPDYFSDAANTPALRPKGRCRCWEAMRGSSHKPADRMSRFTRIVGIFASVLIVWLLAAQVSPGLHQLACGHIHPNAASPAPHACVITDLSQGQGHTPPAPIFVAPVPVETGRVAIPRYHAPIPHGAHRLPPACGPPEY